MKTLRIIAACIVISGCSCSNTPKVTDATLRTEMKEFEKPRVGKVRIETTYRGNERILMVMNYSNVTTRTYCLHGKPIYTESDENGDGFFETFTIAGDSMEDFEQFTRKPDGTTEPISKDKYLEIKKKIHESSDFFDKRLKELR